MAQRCLYVKRHTPITCVCRPPSSRHRDDHQRVDGCRPGFFTGILVQIGLYMGLDPAQRPGAGHRRTNRHKGTK